MTAQANVNLPRLSNGCPVFIVDQTDQLAVLPLTCSAAGDARICAGTKRKCDEVGRIDTVLQHSLARDYNYKLIRYRAFYNKMKEYTEFDLGDLPSEGEQRIPKTLTGITKLGATVKCNSKSSFGIELHDLDDIETTSILKDLVEREDVPSQQVMSACHSYLTEYLHTPKAAVACEPSKDAVVAYLDGLTLAGFAVQRRQSSSCRQGFPEFLTTADQVLNEDGLDHDYFNFRIRNHQGKLGPKLDWPPLLNLGKDQFYAPLGPQNLANNRVGAPPLQDLSYSEDKLLQLRRTLAASRAPELHADQIKTASEFLSQVFSAQVQRRNFSQLTSIHQLCDSFHKVILDHISEPVLAAASLPDCGHKLSALKSIILEANKDTDIEVLNWTGQIISEATAQAVLAVLQSKHETLSEAFLSALEVETPKDLADFRSSQPTVLVH